LLDRGLAADPVQRRCIRSLAGAEQQSPAEQGRRDGGHWISSLPTAGAGAGDPARVRKPSGGCLTCQVVMLVT
jgi:hypothetical protein